MNAAYVGPELCCMVRSSVQRRKTGCRLFVRTDKIDGGPVFSGRAVARNDRATASAMGVGGSAMAAGIVL